jgi:hypothetical protein
MSGGVLTGVVTLLGACEEPLQHKGTEYRRTTSELCSRCYTGANVVTRLISSQLPNCGRPSSFSSFLHTRLAGFTRMSTASYVVQVLCSPSKMEWRNTEKLLDRLRGQTFETQVKMGNLDRRGNRSVKATRYYQYTPRIPNVTT